MPTMPAAAKPHRAPGLAVGLCLCVIALSACQSLPASWRIPKDGQPAPVTARSTLDADDLFAYVQHLLRFSRDELAQEILLRRSAVQSDHRPLDQAKLALALTLPNQNQRDTTKALLAMTDAPRDSALIGGQAAVMLNYVEALLAWQARQEDTLQGLLQSERPPAASSASAADMASLQSLAQRLRNDLKRNETQVETLTVRLREEKLRADTLQQKIDALTSLEKSLAERKSARTDGSR